MNLEDADSDIGEDEEFDIEKIILKIDEQQAKSREDSRFSFYKEEQKKEISLSVMSNAGSQPLGFFSNKENRDGTANVIQIGQSKKRKLREISNSNEEEHTR